MFAADEVIFKQGDDSPEFFFLLRGSVSLTVSRIMYPGVTISVKTVYDGA